ncbi:MAG: 4Fe-4S dicluster domain-containing protein [Gammaproteobacteria bacterium]|nr:4Fe-4S dicluster domain-containing protein [Gammaproteobacteria bacterium]
MSDSIDKSRRGFFTGKLLTREGREEVKVQVKRLGLIPPGLRLSISASNCQNCAGNCEKICPQKIIKLHPESHDLAGQPYLDFNNNGCTFCSECNKACPNFTTDPLHSRPDLGNAFLDQEKCYAWLNITCMSCMNSCPVDLIKFNKKRKPSISLKSCNGCGFCITNCPASAININPTANS